MRKYEIEYRIFEHSEVEKVELSASSKENAYDKAVYEIIPMQTGEFPYSAWVNCVTYANGKKHKFNTCEGMAY